MNRLGALFPLKNKKARQLTAYRAKFRAYLRASALAVFIKRPQADYQIGATHKNNQCVAWRQTA
jgi:hypothetical protein